MLRDVTGEEQSLTFSADLPALCLSMCVRMYVYVNDEFLVFGHQFVSNIHNVPPIGSVNALWCA